MKRLEIGVFLPIGNNGFLMSRSSPQYHPTYEHNKQISQLAEEIGLDYVFSMAKWRGYGGVTEFWDHTLESFTLMTGLAVATQRVGLIATVNPLLFHPAAIAKMAVTADHISGGRFGLNLITGGALEEYSQMGVVPEHYRTRRYEYLQEWVTALKKLWTEERVTFEGEWFQLVDCISNPKPRQTPHPFLVCAGTSEEGMAFTARNCDYQFLGGNTIEETKNRSRLAKAIAADAGRTVKTATNLFVVQSKTRREADLELQRIVDGADLVAVENVWTIMRGQGRQGASQRAERLNMDGAVKVSYASPPIPGSAEDIAEHIVELATEGELDSLLLIFADYVRGLEMFGESVMPLLEGRLDVGTTLAA